MSNLRVLCRDHPQRTIALVTSNFALIFQHSSADPANNTRQSVDTPRCLVEFCSLSSIDLKDYRLLGDGYGTLGLISLNEDVFLCVISGSSRAATVRPGETVSRIDSVEFYCLNRSEYEYGLNYESGSQFAAEEFDRDSGFESKEVVTEHPFLALKKLLSDGSFYFSVDFNLTDRLQDRSDKSTTFDIETLDEDMLWNSYMISPLLIFRGHLPPDERTSLDSSYILTCVIRGFSSTLTIPASVSVLPQVRTNFPSTLTIISRQSSRRAGTRFNSRGIDDDGNVSNFVETEVVLWCPPGITFSYVQVRGSVPIFWEQTAGFLPGQQRIEVTRSPEATQHAFDKHFESLELEYGAVHVVNLLSELKPAEAELSSKFREHIAKSSLRRSREIDTSADHSLLRVTEYDFHAETRGPQGYGTSQQIKYELITSLDGFACFLSEDFAGIPNSTGGEKARPKSSSVVLQQEGVFRTNCLDCLDRTNLVQTIISSMALESFLFQQGGKVTPDIQMRHSALWADNGDALSKIYAGTGALKSSFTRHGKMSIAGALADARKSATRLYVNNFADKARQKTIDLLLGRLTNQVPVYLYDPVNDIVSEELSRRAAEYSFTKPIKLWTGTFNVNGHNEGPDADLTPWLFPNADQDDDDPTIFAVGLQEIVELSPQQIMSTNPSTRKVWEKAVKDCLNKRSASKGTGNYVLLRSGQLVGAALLIYVKEEALKDVKNVEGSVKKTGLSGIGGNKGGCAIRFDISNTRICFVTAHLAAGFANYDERNRDFETIHQGLRFQKNRSIEDHDTIIWLGDFNYRIGLGNQRVRELVLQKNYDRLYENDQLNLQMIAGRAFQFYSEGPIAFPPTYKYDIGTNEYDTSEKNRIPAWCDRILWRGTNLRQTHYSTADLQLSDHRPVWAHFDCTISVIDESLKDKLRKILYGERQHDLSGMLTDATRQGDAEGVLLSSDLIGFGLPPASSDRSKWWLDYGAPVRSRLRPPAAGLIPNSHRTSNPFSPCQEADWIRSSISIDQGSKMDPIDLDLRKPPLSPRQDSSDASSNQSMKRREITLRLLATTADNSVPGTDVSDTSRIPPPIPRKPVSLSSRHGYVDTSERRDENSLGSSVPSKDLRSLETPSSIALRPRDRSPQRPFEMDSNGRALLDDDVGDAVGWTPLLPNP